MRILLPLPALLAALLLAGPAAALTFTIDDDLGTPGFQPIIGFVAGNVTVNIHPVEDVSGTFSLLTGSVTTPAAQDWFLFVIEVTAGTLVDEVGVGLFGSDAVGIAHFDDPDVTPSGGDLSDTTTPLFEFGAPNLTPGDQSDRLIVAYNLGDLPPPGLEFPPLPADTASFMISDDSVNDFSITTNVVLVPEPGSLALLGLGLLGLVAATPRRRTR